MTQRWIMLLVVIWLAGCGVRGSLTLPEEEVADTDAPRALPQADEQSAMPTTPTLPQREQPDVSPEAELERMRRWEFR